MDKQNEVKAVEGKKEMTEEQKAKKKASDKAWLEARTKIRDKVVEFVNKNKATLGDVADDILVLAGKKSVTSGQPRAARKSITSELKDFLIAKKTCSLMDIFKQFKIGEPEMNVKMRAMLLPAKPEDRVWVKYDEKTETYTVVGTGANPPAGWTGYDPTKAKAL